MKDSEEQLNSFDEKQRNTALISLLNDNTDKLPAERSNVNMHFHSFFSYNARNYSPSRIIWESRKAGLYAAGLCDFDVLDGQEEFLDAGLMLSIRTAVSLETRAYLKEYANADISSPGENGVTYIMGSGFAKRLPEGSPQAEGLAQYREGAKTRNVNLISRINPSVTDIAIDYQNDVLPLTPSGAATERHIVTAYINKSKSVFEGHAKLTEFWSALLEQDTEATGNLIANLPALEDAVRNKLAKRGGVGYEPPSVDTFPPVDDFINWVASCEAIPMITWLDGTSDGEKDGKALLECMHSKGAAALNIIPDRNWNISDPETKAIKLSNLKDIVEIADNMDIPIIIGTEMNKLGLPFVDDLECEALNPFKENFLRGTRIVVGHSSLLRYADFSYVGAKANSEFVDTKAKNAFFEAVGAMQPISQKQAKELKDMGNEKAFEWLNDHKEIQS